MADTNPWWAVTILFDDYSEPLVIIGLASREAAETAVEVLRGCGLWCPCTIVAPDGSSYVSDN